VSIPNHEKGHSTNIAVRLLGPQVLIVVLIFARMMLGQSLQNDDSRPVTVRDSIEASVVSSGPGGQIAYFSPDKNRFAIVLRKGDLAKDTNEYSLLIYRIQNALRPSHESTVHLSSSTDSPAMSNIQWLDDDTIAFIGIDGNKAPRVYSFEIPKKTLKKWPVPPGSVVTAFDTTPDRSVFAEISHSTRTGCLADGSRAAGLLITTQQLADLLSNGCPNPNQLFIGKSTTVPTQVTIRESRLLGTVSLSPNGRYAVVMESISSDSDELKRYNVPPDYFALRYFLVDTRTRAIRPLIDAPALPSRSREPVWSHDGRYAIVTNTCVPLMSRTETTAGTTPSLFTAEIDVETGAAIKISSGLADLLNWDPATQTLLLRPRQMLGPSQAPVAYRKRNGNWEETSNQAGKEPHFGTQVLEVEDMNTPPRLYILDDRTKERAPLLDPNPQFKYLRFGKVEQIAWTGSKGEKEKGGIYLPPDYSEGKKYPLVIQLEGWDPTQFWIDGPSTAGYAAQELAGRGFVVAQLPLPSLDDLTTTKEGPAAMDAVEGVINYLDHQGFIDRGRIGLFGWSRTGFHVRYILEFSKHQIAAAVIADGMDASYFQYLSWLTISGSAGYTYERINGGVPFGDGLQSWLKNATGFNLTRVHTPVLLFGFRQYSLLNNWEWFTGLSQLRKPVEFVWLRDAVHSPQKPSERTTAQGGAVDWFSFWLQGKQDSDPGKTTQYVRWNELRKLRDADIGTRPQH
jgi:hypothetical protein